MTLTRPRISPSGNCRQLRVQNPSLTVSAAAGVLSNDQDPDGDTKFAEVVDPPSTGTLDLQPDGSFTFQYGNGLSATETFTYRVTDGRDVSNTVTVTLTRQPNQPPVATDDSYQVPLSSPFTVPKASGVLANDSDNENNTIIPTVVSQPAVGSVSLQTDGSFTYTFPDDFVGTVTFSYQVADATDTGNTATVSLTRRAMVDTTAGKLTIVGTDDSTTLRLSLSGGGILVEIQRPTGTIRQEVKPTMPAKKFTDLAIYLGTGDDHVDTTPCRSRSAHLHRRR